MVYFSRFRGTQQVSVAHATCFQSCWRYDGCSTQSAFNEVAGFKLENLSSMDPFACRLFPCVYIYIVFWGDQVATPYSIHSPSFSTHILAVYILPSQSLSLWFKWSTPDGLLAGFEEDEAPDPPPGEHWQEFDSLQQVVLKLGDIHQIPTLHFFF